MVPQPRSAAHTPPGSAADAVAALRDLPPLTQAGVALSVIAPDDSGAHQAYAVNISVAAAHGLAEIAETTRHRLQEATLIEYAATVLIPPSHAMHVRQQTAATLTEIQQVVEVGDADGFDPDADHAARVSMVAAHFTLQDQRTVTFYRIADSLLQFTKNRIFSLVRRGGQYDRLEPADVLLMRATFDVITIDGFAFFFLKPTFERAFGFLDELRESSATTFDSVTAELRIIGVAELRAACTSQPQMMAKMASIRRNMDEDPAYAAAMTMPRLIDYIRANPNVEIEITGIGAQQSLVFNPSPATRFQIVKLLDDDYLRSVLTDRHYEAGSKLRTGDS